MSKYLHVVWAIIFLLFFVSDSSLAHASSSKGKKCPIFSEEEQNWISSHPVISVAIDPNFPPVEFYDNDGTPNGISVGFIQLLAKKTGLQFKFVRVGSWPAVLDGIAQKKIDMLCAVTPSPERQKLMLFTKPVFEIPTVIVTRSGVKDNFKMNDLKGKKVVVVKGYFINDYMAKNHPGIKLYSVPNTRTGLRMVSSGGAFAMLEYLSSVSYYIGKENISNLRIVGETHYYAQLSMATRSDWPMLRQVLDQGLKQISESERKIITGKWISLNPPRFYTQRKFWLIIGGASCGLLVLVLLMLCWNWSLRAVVKQRTQSLKTELDERLRMEQALRVREEQFKTIFENAEDAILIMDQDSLLDCNSMTLKLFGVTREDILGRYIVDFSPEHQPDGILSRDKAMMLAESAFRGEPQYFEWTHCRSDGTLFDCEIKLNRIPIQGKDRLQALVRDISSRQQAQKEKEKLQAQLVQAQKLESVGRLAGGIAHDFNNMLCVIIGYTEKIMRSIDVSWQSYSELEEIRKAAQRSAALTRQLLAFARKETVDPEFLDLNEIVEGMLKMLQRLIGEDIELSWKPEADLGTIYMDPAQVDQILVNLCVNARDAITDMGKVSIETANVVVDADYCIKNTDFYPGEFVMLTVTDNGCGMDPETQAHVFEPFFTTKETGKGTGMGLATIHGIVKQNNGIIYVYSELGQGTTFKIYIPRRMERPRYISADQLFLAGERGNETILLVEDELMLMDLAKEILGHLGYCVLAVDTPSKAIRLAQQFSDNIDLLVTDVIMPEMNGRDLAEKLKDVIPSLKVIYMSGYTANVIEERGLLNHEINFIQKPYNSNDLSKKIREVLDGAPMGTDQFA